MIDTHCHLDILSEFGVPIEDALRHAAGLGIKKILLPATDKESSLFNLETTKNINETPHHPYPELFFALGLHPTNMHLVDELHWVISQIQQNKNNPYFVGIGEIGLDYYHGAKTKSLQKKVLQNHLEVAESSLLPIILHLRDTKNYVSGKTDSVKDFLAIIKDFPHLCGVWHSFSNSYSEAKEFLDLGWFISFSGIVTYNTAKHVQEALKKIPLRFVLAETDSPFLSPHPHRGKTNEPAYVSHTIDKIANIIFENAQNSLLPLVQDIYLIIDSFLKKNTLSFKRKNKTDNTDVTPESYSEISFQTDITLAEETKKEIENIKGNVKKNIKKNTINDFTDPKFRDLKEATLHAIKKAIYFNSIQFINIKYNNNLIKR